MNSKQISDKTEVSKTKNVDNAVAQPSENITGRGVFVIETVPLGVSVRTAFLAEDGRLLDIPAVFPDIVYAMAQIDELKQHVLRRFTEAAQVGSQVIAQQIVNNRAQLGSDSNQETADSSNLTQVETSIKDSTASKDSGSAVTKPEKISKFN